MLSNETLLAYMVVDRVLRLSTEKYGCRYGQFTCFRPHSASKTNANRILLAPIVKEVSNIVSNLLMSFLLQRLTLGFV